MFRQLLLAALVGLAASHGPASKIDSSLSHTLSTFGTADIAVSFNADTQPILNRVNNARFATRGAKITTMKGLLEGLQASSQKNAVSFLNSRSVKYQSFWINNRIYISDATPEIVAELAAIPEVSEIREQVKISLVEPQPSSGPAIQAEWGVDKIGAPAAWDMPGGNNGAGVVVAIIDTGARQTHNDLKNNWRSSYGWFDATSNNSPTPRDGQGHGTHVTGTIAGANGIGVAPGAQWISCKGLNDQGSGSEAGLVNCGQWVACPTQPDGSNANCTMAPAISSNSWGGGGGQRFYDSVIAAWRAANIVPVFAAGNSYFCSTIGSPGDSPDVIGVGSTNSNDAASVFSSRGPANSGILKPDVSAPGTDIVSAGITSDQARATMSGTSMACPHVAGAIALLKSKNPNLTYDQIKNLLQNNAETDLGYALPCGGTRYNEVPNNIYGWGRINVKAALEAVTSA